MEVDKILTVTRPNGLRYLLLNNKLKATCNRCNQSCQVIKRENLLEYMRYLSDCCSASVKFHT